MRFNSTLETIESSKIFKKFKKEHPDSKLVAGFFILDFLGEDNKKSLDYSDKDKIYSFSVDEKNEITLIEDKLIEDKELKQININIKIEINELPDIAEKQASAINSKSKIQKIIAVLQNYEDKIIWNLTCMLEGMSILNILVDAISGEIIKSSKRSLFEFVKKV